MQSSRSRKYGQLDESSSVLSISSHVSGAAALNDDKSTTTRDGSVPSMDSSPITTAVALGPDGQVIMQDIGQKKKSENISLQPRGQECLPLQETQRPKNGRSGRGAGHKPKRTRSRSSKRLEKKDTTISWQRNVTGKEEKNRVLVPHGDSQPNIKGKTIATRSGEGQPKTKANSFSTGEKAITRKRREGGSRSICPHPTRESENQNSEVTGGNVGQQITASSPTPRKPRHLRVYEAANNSPEKGRTRKRSIKQKTRPRRPTEEETFVWRREPTKKAAAEGGAERVDRSTLGEVAKQLEQSKRYEEDTREAVSKIRGRRYRASAIPRSETSSRSTRKSYSPVPGARESSRKQGKTRKVEEKCTLRREASRPRSRGPNRRPNHKYSGDGLKALGFS